MTGQTGYGLHKKVAFQHFFSDGYPVKALKFTVRIMYLVVTFCRVNNKLVEKISQENGRSTRVPQMGKKKNKNVVSGNRN